MVMLVSRAGQLPKGVPSTLTPGEEARPSEPGAVVCSVKSPTTSGERVMDWFAPPFRPASLP
jgi:hypothetical protein